MVSRTSSIISLSGHHRNQALLGQVLAKAGYEVAAVFSAKELLLRLESDDIFMGLIDIHNFDYELLRACQELRSHCIPFAMITPPHCAHRQHQFENEFGTKTQWVVKPLRIRNLLLLIHQTASHPYE